MNEQPTYEQVLIDRLSQRIGQASVALEAQQLQIESLRQCLRDNGIDPETLRPTNAAGNGDLTSDRIES